MDVFAQLNSTVHGYAAQALAPKPGYVQGWDLYKDTDFTQLNVVERWWAEYYAAIPPWLATGIMSFVIHELIYFGRCLPYWVLDQIPAMQKYKLQEKMPSREEYLKSLKSVLLSHFTIQLPQIVSFGPICESLGLKTYHVPFRPPLRWRGRSPSSSCSRTRGTTRSTASSTATRRCTRPSTSSTTSSQ